MCGGSGFNCNYYKWVYFIRRLTTSWYFSIFQFMILSENLSLQYVNSMNCIVILSL